MNAKATPLSRDKVPRPEPPCDEQAASLRTSGSSGSEYLLFSVEIGNQDADLFRARSRKQGESEADFTHLGMARPLAHGMV